MGRREAEKICLWFKKKKKKEKFLLFFPVREKLFKLAQNTFKKHILRVA